MKENKYLKLGNESYNLQNYKEALFWYTKAATEGNIEAQNRLGFMYCGFGITPDLDKAIYWYDKASEQGDGKASFELAEIYCYKELFEKVQYYYGS